MISGPIIRVDEMLARSARDRAQSVAIAWKGGECSYRELDQDATRIAAFLRAQGVHPGARVAICGPKLPLEPGLIYGILRAGCVLVHINPFFRTDQARLVLDETEPAAIFFHESRSALVTALGERSPRLRIRVGSERGAGPPATHEWKELWDQSGAEVGFASVSSADHDASAAIIYTSGTTASAKGIVVTQRILSDATRVSAEVLSNSHQDRLISLTPFSFDGALSQLFTAVYAGGSLVLQSSPLPRDVVNTLLDQRITGFHAMPSFWRMALDRLPSLAEQRFPDLRYLSIIGESYPRQELERLRGILPGTDIYMMYGITEAFRSTCLPPTDLDRKPGSAGLALPGVEIAVVDDRGRPCAAGVIGEIVHRGAFVSPGYWRREHGRTFQDGAVVTGDLGWLDEEGYLYFDRRADSMIKRLGLQVHPEEIEASLESIPGVRRAAVVADGGDGGVIRLHAFIAVDPGQALSVESIQQHCRLALPHYMQPDTVTLCADLPLTGTCKIDRARLSAQGLP